MIRHFGIFPHNFDKENLLEDQKIFLIYLMASIPDMEYWKRNVEYKSRLIEIKSLKKININQTEYDLADISGKSKKQVYKEQLLLEKKRRISELNKEFGIDEIDEDIEKTVEIKQDIKNTNPEKLWELLQGKGLVK